MIKLFKKLFTPIAIFSMALGVSISLNNQKEEIHAKAATSSLVIADVATANGWTNGVKYSSFTNGPLTLTATGGTNTGKYYSSDKTWRFYSSESAKLTITGDATVERIDSVTTTPTKTFTIDGKTATHNFTSNGNFTNIQIVYTLVGAGNIAVAGVSLPATESVFVGQTTTLIPVFNPTDATNKNVTWNTSNSGIASVNDGVVTGVSAGSAVVTVTTEDGGYEASTTVTVNEVTTYSKLTSLSQLHIGARYVIGGSKGDPLTTWVMSTTQNSNNRGAVLATMAGSNIVESPETQVFVLEEGSVDNTFAFKAYNGATVGQYIYSAGGVGSNNYLRSQTTLDGNSSWKILFSAGVWTAQSQGDASRNILKLNSSSALFSSYSSGQAEVDLYVDLSSIDDNAYAKAYNLAYDINVGLGNNALGSCEASLLSISTRYDLLSASAKTVFDTNSGAEFVQARERVSYLTSWVAANPSARPIMTNNGKNNLFAVITIGSIGLTSILAYFFINKKKVLR